MKEFLKKDFMDIGLWSIWSIFYKQKEKKTQQIQIIISFRGFEFNVEVCEQIVSVRA